MNNLKENKILSVVLSIVIAVALWLFVVNEVNADASDTIHNVPISVTGESVLESRDLMITDQDITSMDIKLVGNRNALVQLTRDSITVTADVSSINEAGEYALRCSVAAPNSNAGGTISVIERDTYLVQFTVENKVKKTIPVEGIFTGSVADGYQAESFIFSPSSIEIVGPSSLIDSIECARVTLNADELKATYSGILPYEFLSADGSEIGAEEVEAAASNVYVVYPIVMVKELMIRPAFLAGGGATEDHVSYELSHESIHVSGDEEDIADLTDLVLGPIDLSKVGTTGSFTYPILLPTGVTNESGFAEVSVSVKVIGLTTKNFETDNIELINIPDGFYAETVTQSLKVTVRGSRETVETVTASKIQVVADLAQISGSEGQFRVPVKVYLNSTGDVGVFGADYSISVNLWK